MYEAHVTVRIRAPIEEVFEAVIYHERFFDGPDQEYCQLVVEGAGERNGLGAVREIGVSGLVFREEITGFERQTRCEYVVRSLETRNGRRVPMRHEGGWIHLTEGEDVTEPTKNTGDAQRTSLSCAAMRSFHTGWIGVLVASTLALPARADEAGAWGEMVFFAWGEGDGELGRRPVREEELGWGPHGFALSPTGGCSLGQPTSRADLPAALALAMALLGVVALTSGRGREQA